MDRQDLAKGIVSYSHLSNIESGRFIPSEEILVSLSRRLKVPEEYLIKYNEKDQHLEELIISLKMKIDQLDVKEAANIINKIQSNYPFISSLFQEIFFNLLKGYFFYKKGDTKKTIAILEKSVLPGLENSNFDILPSDFKEVYYYLLGIKAFFNEDYYSSYHFFIQQSSLIKSELLKGINCFNIALALYKTNNILSAVTYAEKALTIYLHEHHWENAGDADNLLGVLYWENKDFKNAERYLNHALKISNQYKLIKLKGKILHNLGLIYKDQKIFEKSLEYFYQSLDIKKQYDLKNNILITYNSILHIYIDQEELFKAEEILKEAKVNCINEHEQYFLKAVEAKLNNKLQKFDTYELLMEEAANYFFKNGKWGYAKEIAFELGNYYLDLKRYKQASLYLKTAFEAGEKICKEV